MAMSESSSSYTAVYSSTATATTSTTDSAAASTTANDSAAASTTDNEESFYFYSTVSTSAMKKYNHEDIWTLKNKLLKKVQAISAKARAYRRDLNDDQSGFSKEQLDEHAKLIARKICRMHGFEDVFGFTIKDVDPKITPVLFEIAKDEKNTKDFLYRPLEMNPTRYHRWTLVSVNSEGFSAQLKNIAVGIIPMVVAFISLVWLFQLMDENKGLQKEQSSIGALLDSLPYCSSCIFGRNQSSPTVNITNNGLACCPYTKSNTTCAGACNDYANKSDALSTNYHYRLADALSAAILVPVAFLCFKYLNIFIQEYFFNCKECITELKKIAENDLLTKTVFNVYDYSRINCACHKRYVLHEQSEELRSPINKVPAKRFKKIVCIGNMKKFIKPPWYSSKPPWYSRENHDYSDLDQIIQDYLGPEESDKRIGEEAMRIIAEYSKRNSNFQFELPAISTSSVSSASSISSTSSVLSTSSVSSASSDVYMPEAKPSLATEKHEVHSIKGDSLIIDIDPIDDLPGSVNSN